MKGKLKKEKYGEMNLCFRKNENNKLKKRMDPGGWEGGGGGGGGCGWGGVGWGRSVGLTIAVSRGAGVGVGIGMDSRV